MSSPIKIAYLLTPVEFGGSERVILNYLKNADRNRFDIHPVLLVRPWEKDNFFIEKLRESNYPFSKIPVALRPGNEGRDYLRVLRCIKNLFSILRGQSFQIIHSHGYFADIIAIPASKILHIPHISTCHGFISTDKHLILYNSLDRLALRFCDKIIAVSESIEQDLMRSGIAQSRIVLIQNEVRQIPDLNQISRDRKIYRQSLGIGGHLKLIGFVGRLSEEKGVRYLIEAGVILKECGEAFRITIIGDGPQKKELETLTIKKGLGRETTFLGFQSDIDRWLPALDIFVLPSLTEGTPMALLEALSFGIPVVATNVGGVPQVIKNGVNGILVNPADSRALADSLKTLIRDDSILKRMSEQALNSIEKEDKINDWCKKIEAQYSFFQKW